MFSEPMETWASWVCIFLGGGGEELSIASQSHSSLRVHDLKKWLRMCQRNPKEMFIKKKDTSAAHRSLAGLLQVDSLVIDLWTQT